VVVRSPDRRAELAADLSGVPAYDSLADLLAAGDFPVPAAQAVHTLEVLDAVRTSAAENRVVELPEV
jgi:predicted dehydrogenase